MTRALLLSAYDAASHRMWRETITSHLDDFDWTVVTLPPRHFSWRFRGNALTFGAGEFPNESFDLVLATSTVNLAALLGLRPNLQGSRLVVYFHENQFEYPSRKRTRVDPNHALQEVLTASVADHVLFNSEWNRSSFMGGAARFLARMPDGVPPGVLEQINGRTQILPVPVACRPRSGERRAGPLRLVWNHRWEFDKGPEILLELIRALDQTGSKFELAVVGQQFETIPPELQQLGEEFKHAISQWGWLESRAEYLELLRRSDVVLSTAHHEFQGLAVIEALMAGCRAFVPNGLAYPEYVPEDQLWEFGDVGLAAGRLAAWCAEPARLSNLDSAQVDQFRIESLLPAYRAVLSS